MLGVNKVILIGNLGKDPEVRRTATGSSVCSFPLATTERFVDKTGNRQEKTEWHNIVAWGKLADLVGQYLKKGRSAYIEGKITNRSWDDRDGNKRYRTEIIASTVQFLDGGNAGPAAGPRSQSEPVMDYEPAEMAGVAENMSQPIGEDDLPF